MAESVAETPSPLIDDLPESIPYLIIGGGTSCFAAVRAIRAGDPTSKVLIISDSKQLPYMKPPLSKELWFTPPEVASSLQFRQFDGKYRPLAFEKPEFYFSLARLMQRDSGGVALVSGQRVTRIDAEKQTVFLENGQSLNYDKCLIATGGERQSHAVLDSSDSQVKAKVIDFQRIEDFLDLQAQLPGMKRILIHGGGLLGTELAVAIASSAINSGLQVVQLFPEEGVLWRLLPEYLSRWVSRQVEASGVKLMSKTDVQSASVKNNRLVLHLTNGSEVEADGVVVTERLEVIEGGNKRLADASGLELDPRLGGFVVNAELQARSNLWVAGDAACFFDQKLGRRRVQQHDQAVISGRLAGENMTGARKPLKQQAMFWSDLTPTLGFEAAGLIDSSLETVGVFAAERTEGESKAADAVEPSYEKGVVFYLREKKIVGVLMMNLFNRVRLARRILKDDRTQDDLSDVAKWFNIYSAEE